MRSELTKRFADLTAAVAAARLDLELVEPGPVTEPELVELRETAREYLAESVLLGEEFDCFIARCIAKSMPAD